MLILVYVAEVWPFGTDVSPCPGRFVIRLLDYSYICLPGLRFPQYIHCLKQIEESAPLTWTGIASWNKTFTRLLSVVNLSITSATCLCEDLWVICIRTRLPLSLNTRAYRLKSHWNYIVPYLLKINLLPIQLYFVLHPK